MFEYEATLIFDKWFLVVIALVWIVAITFQTPKRSVWPAGSLFRDSDRSICSSRSGLGSSRVSEFLKLIFSSLHTNVHHGGVGSSHMDFRRCHYYIDPMEIFTR